MKRIKYEELSSIKSLISYAICLNPGEAAIMVITGVLIILTVCYLDSIAFVFAVIFCVTSWEFFRQKHNAEDEIIDIILNEDVEVIDFLEINHQCLPLGLNAGDHQPAVIYDPKNPNVVALEILLNKYPFMNRDIAIRIARAYVVKISLERAMQLLTQFKEDEKHKHESKEGVRVNV